ncbi:hypothetical protein HWV62_24169 [Athelia sp. TMB]|nr:hypothetical protein HWV62_24169 [Athelia sp. TMB]
MTRMPHLRVLALSQLAIGALASAKPVIQWVNCAEHVPIPLQGTSLPNPLPSTLHCGLLDVPMDYSKPISSSNNITIGFAMHRPKNPQGLLNFNPGGPDAEVASFAWDISLNISNADWFTGLSNFDFLDVTLTIFSPSNATELAFYTTSAATFAASCAAGSTPTGILAHVGTADVVKDWDTGNQAVATYQVAAANRLLLRSDAWCMNDTTCPFHTQGKGAVPKALAAVLAQAAAGNTSNLTVTPADVGAMASLGYLNGSPKFPTLNGALAAALGGDWSGFDWSVVGPELAQGIYPLLATACLDRHLDYDSWPSFEKIKNAVFSNDTAKIGYAFDLQITASAK